MASTGAFLAGTALLPSCSPVSFWGLAVKRAQKAHWGPSSSPPPEPAPALAEQVNSTCGRVVPARQQGTCWGD